MPKTAIFNRKVGVDMSSIPGQERANNLATDFLGTIQRRWDYDVLK